MSDVEDIPTARSVLVGVGIGKYDHLQELPRAVSDIESVASLLGEDGFSPHTILNQSRDVSVQALYDALPTEGLGQSGTALVVMWAGHASQNADTGALRLLTTGNRADDPDALVVTADEVAEIAARTGASQLLILVDTCYSGSAVVDVARVVDAVRRKLVDGQHRWVGVVASCQDYERAVDGALGRKLLELLERGPTSHELKIRWSSYQAGVRGDDLVDALLKEWGESRQAPKQLSSGNPWPIMPNPLYRAGAPEQVVEHLLWAARGAAQNEAGIWFTGRVAPLKEIVAWLGAGRPGLCVVSGPAGCGKSAVVGRIVSLSNRHEREEIAAAQGLPPKELDPGEGVVSAHLQVRGMTLERCSDVLARALGVIGQGPVPSHHDVLAWAGSAARVPVIVVDGLDEAGMEGFRIAGDLLAPLASYALVLVASREIPGNDASPSLLSSLGGAEVNIDLEANPADTDRDVHGYVLARLTGGDGLSISEVMDPEPVADEVVRLARADDGAAEGPFLLARILTSRLIEAPADTSDADWKARLAVSVEDALDQDLARGRPLVRDGRELRHAGRELLSTLAYSYGSGFPADDVWPAVASSLSPTHTEYERLDSFWALGEYGRYVTVSSISGQAVYRLHQRVADTLRGSHGINSGQRAADTTGARVAQTVLQVYERFLHSGMGASEHPYLWLYAWVHAVDGGQAAVDHLQRLSTLDSSLRPDVAMSLAGLGIRYSEMGRYVEAVAPTERAVKIYEELIRENPAFLNDLASSLNDLGNRYSEAGRRVEAVAPTERAVKIYEDLIRENPAFLNDLASSLDNLGIHYGQAGRRVEAVAPTERAIKIREELVDENPVFLYDLANSLNNLGNRYSDSGRYIEAVAPAERAVEIYEDLVGENPGFLKDLAGSLNNLGVHYSKAGRHVEATAPTERAVKIYEDLVGENPVFLQDLAGSLNNLGIRYSQAGRRVEGVAPTERAVKIYEELIPENPGFLQDLAGSLNNLGIRYSQAGRRVEAVAPTERAVKIYEELVGENPGFLNDLASSLNNLGTRYNEAGRRVEAVAPTERAVKIREELVRENPAFLHALASSLNNLGNHYSEAGRHLEAIAPTERAVKIYEGLSRENRGFLNHLGMSLNNLGIHYSEAGRRMEAVAPTERAVKIREELVRENPAFLSDLASSLNNLGARYSDSGRYVEAVTPAERAVEIYEDLARKNPAFLHDLASSLNNIGVHYRMADRHVEAVAPTERSAQIYEELARENPAFLNSLARSLNNIGNRYGDSGQHVEAVAPTERSVQIYEELAHENPAFLNELAGSLNNLGKHYAEAGRNLDGSRRWNETLERFSADSRASVALRLRRARSKDELDETIDDLLEAYRLDPHEDAHLTADVHSTCRAVRARNQEHFDPAWLVGTGELPAWLILDIEVLEMCVKWIGMPTWAASHEYLTANRERLLSDTAETALAELALSDSSNSTIPHHHTLLQGSRRDGIGVTYRPVLIGETVNAWRSIGDLAESKNFLITHSDQLLTEEAALVLVQQQDVVGQALLVLARHGASEQAYGLITHSESCQGVLIDARRHADDEKLRAIALLCSVSASDDQQRATAAVHLAIGLAIADRMDEALSIVREARGDGEIAAHIVDLTDAITHRTQHAANLATLIRALSENDAPPE